MELKLKLDLGPGPGPGALKFPQRMRLVARANWSSLSWIEMTITEGQRAASFSSLFTFSQPALPGLTLFDQLGNDETR